MADHVYFKFRKELNISNLVSLFYYKSPKNFIFTGESHNFWEFIYIDKGKMQITAADKQYVLKAGEIAFHMPNEFHAVRAYEQIPSHFIIASFVCKAPCMAFFEHRIANLNSRERECLYDALRYWQSYTYLPQTPIGQEQLVQQNLEMLLIRLIQRNESTSIEQQVESYTAQTICGKLTENIIQYMECHVTQPLTLNHIANDLGYSVSQMKKLFNKQNSAGIIDFFIQIKMDEAKRLLLEGEMNISQISRHLGYTDASYFSRLFKSRLHMTPSEYCRSFGDSGRFSVLK